MRPPRPHVIPSRRNSRQRINNRRRDGWMGAEVCWMTRPLRLTLPIPGTKTTVYGDTVAVTRNRYATSLNGPQGVVVAIINQARKDMLFDNAYDAGRRGHEARQSAAAYFLSEQYRHHLAWLDMPFRYPIGITEERLKEVVK